MAQEDPNRFDPRPGEEYHGRLHWFTLDELSAEQRAFVDELNSGPRGGRSLDEQGRLSGAYNARLLDPPVGTAIQKFAAACRWESHIAKKPRWREIVILEVFRHGHNNFEWNGHAGFGRAEGGFTDEEIEALRTGQDAPTFTPEDRVLRRVAQEIIWKRDLSDELYEEAKQVIGLEILFDAISLIGHYQHTTLALKIWRVPLREGTKLTFEPEY